MRKLTSILCYGLLVVQLIISTCPVVAGSNSSSVAKCRDNKPFEMHNVCKCPRAQQQTLASSNQTKSTCSEHSAARGPGQKVVSYSFFGTVFSDYFNSTEGNIQQVPEKYPGWIMRLYHNLSLQDSHEKQVICNLWCKYPHFDACHVEHLPEPLCNKKEIFGMMWRFFVLGDPLVDRFIVRDLDSIIYQREVDAVKEWIESGKTWHAMRDHPYHWIHILGGMWGGSNKDLNLTTNIRSNIITIGGNYWDRGFDQDVLYRTIYKPYSKDILVHDSYQCIKYNDSLPFPTRRNKTEFVGANFPDSISYILPECPKVCRPKDHQDWLYC